METSWKQVVSDHLTKNSASGYVQDHIRIHTAKPGLIPCKSKGIWDALVLHKLFQTQVDERTNASGGNLPDKF
jgi:hypothetical protein